MRKAISRAALAALTGAGAVIWMTGTAQAAGSDNHHEFKPSIDCRKNSYGPVAILSPTIYYNSVDRSSTVCYANDNAGHPSVTHLFGLLNLT